MMKNEVHHKGHCDEADIQQNGWFESESREKLKCIMLLNVHTHSPTHCRKCHWPCTLSAIFPS